MEVYYECLNRNYDSYVEVTIPLDYFQDISLFFQKECKTYSYFNVFAIFKASSFFDFIFRLIFSLTFLFFIFIVSVIVLKKIN